MTPHFMYRHFIMLNRMLNNIKNINYENVYMYHDIYHNIGDKIMKIRIDVSLEKYLVNKLADLENKFGLDKGQIIEISLKRNLSDIEDKLHDLIPIADVNEKRENKIDSEWKFQPEELVSTVIENIKITLSKTDVKNKHISIPKRYHHLFPPIMRSRNHDLENNKLFTIIADGKEYETHLEGANRLPHITDIFNDHPELSEGNIIYLDVIEPKKRYQLRF